MDTQDRKASRGYPVISADRASSLLNVHGESAPAMHLSVRPHVLLHGCSNRSKHGRPPAPAEEHAEPRWAAGAVGAADRARAGAEQRARTTADTIVAAAQNGTSGVSHPPGGLGHSEPRAADERYETFLVHEKTAETLATGTHVLPRSGILVVFEEGRGDCGGLSRRRDVRVQVEGVVGVVGGLDALKALVLGPVRVPNSVLLVFGHEVDVAADADGVLDQGRPILP